MTKYIAPRMLDVHGRSIIEWHVIDSPNVRWNEVHRFGCVIRLHVNLYMAYCRKNISRSCWREIYLISKSNTNFFINTNHILWKNNAIWFIFHWLYIIQLFFFVISTKARNKVYKQKCKTQIENTCTIFLIINLMKCIIHCFIYDFIIIILKLLFHSSRKLIFSLYIVRTYLFYYRFVNALHSTTWYTDRQYLYFSISHIVERQ